MATMIIAQQSSGGLIISSSSTGTQGPPGPAGGISALTADVTASGTGSVPATVAAIQGVVISGAAAGGNVLTATGTLAAHWAAPAAGGITQLAGDVTAGPGSGSVAATVVRVNGATVPAAGALTTGNAAYVSGASALTYSALNLAGGAGWITGLLPVANFAPGTAGQLFVSNATPNAAWTSLISYETTHGRFQSGGGGSDYKVIIGPMVGFETTDTGLWMLPNATAATATNFIIDATSNLVTYNSPGAANMAVAGVAAVFYMASSGTTVRYGAISASSPLMVDWSTATTPLVQSGTSATSLTVGTNKAGATLVLSADANVKNLALLENSGTVNEADFYAPDGTHKINVLVGNNGSATIGTLTSTAGLILQAGNAATALTLGNPSGTLLSSTFNSYRISRFITKGSNYTIDSAGTGDEQIWMTAAATITLPNPAGLAGRVLEIIVNYDPAVGGGTIARNGAELINGAASNITLGTSDKFEIFSIRSNGTDWVISKGMLPGAISP